MRLSILALVALVGVVGCEEPAPAPTPDEAKSEPAEAKAEEQAPKADPHDAFANLAVDRVATLLSDKSCVPVDANNADTREKYGVVPGAVLLSSSQGYQLSELPEDKSTKLVFYCGGKRCSAAPKAAKLASEAGYKDVNVMRDGIRGWVDAGQKVDTPKS